MNFFDTVEALEDRRAVVKESMHGDQIVLLTKSQEREDKMLMMMERQAEVLKRQMERQEHQDEVSVQRQERQDEVWAQRQERQDEVSAQRERRQERQDERQNHFSEWVSGSAFPASESQQVFLPIVATVNNVCC